MKKLFIGAAMCGAAVAFASAANAADDNKYEFLYGSTDALILGPTGIATPSAGYISSAVDIYLGPLGYDGTTESTSALTLPNTWDFFRSVPGGQAILVNAILDDYNAGDMGCDASGVCTDPLTIFTYSQSSLVAAYAQEQLADAGVPTDALRFVMVGANPEALPSDLFPTQVFNIDGDIFTGPVAESWINLLFGGTSWMDVLYGLALHQAYLGLTEDQIGSATTIVDGLTTINEIPTLSFDELWTAIFSAYFGV